MRSQSRETSALPRVGPRRRLLIDMTMREACRLRPSKGRDGCRHAKCERKNRSSAAIPEKSGSQESATTVPTGDFSAELMAPPGVLSAQAGVGGSHGWNRPRVVRRRRRDDSAKDEARDERGMKYACDDGDHAAAERSITHRKTFRVIRGRACAQPGANRVWDSANIGERSKSSISSATCWRWHFPVGRRVAMCS